MSCFEKKKTKPSKYRGPVEKHVPIIQKMAHCTRGVSPIFLWERGARGARGKRESWTIVDKIRPWQGMADGNAGHRFQCLLLLCIRWCVECDHLRRPVMAHDNSSNVVVAGFYMGLERQVGCSSGSCCLRRPPCKARNGNTCCCTHVSVVYAHSNCCRVKSVAKYNKLTISFWNSGLWLEVHRSLDQQGFKAFRSLPAVAPFVCFRRCPSLTPTSHAFYLYLG